MDMNVSMDLKSCKGGIIERNDVVNNYLKQISKYPILTAEEEIELFKEVANGNTDAREKLILYHQRFIFAIAKRYAIDNKLMDLVEEANIGLMEAIEAYDYKSGNRFLTYAVWFIRRSIVTYLNEMSPIIKKTNRSKTIFKSNKVRNKFFNENCRYPSNEEMVKIFEEEYGIKIVDADDFNEVKLDSISSVYNEDDEEAFENSSIFTTKTASYNDYEDEINNDYYTDIATRLLEPLNEREKVIMKMAFGIGYDKEYTNDEIAFELGITSERVRQLKNFYLKKFKNILKSVNA